MHDTVVEYSRLAQFRGLLALARPRQWIKNTFVLAPLVFTGAFANADSTLKVWWAAVLFCVASSATYIVNDLHDIESDRRHPTKSRKRPLAAGIVPVPLALGLLVVLYAILVWAAFLVPAVMTVIGAYLALNLAYTFALKREPVVDIFIIALCFVLRVYAGAEALAVPVSGWMFITTLCLALYLASIKRRQEISQSGTGGREVLKRYSVVLVDRYAEMSGTGALVFYSMFVMSAKPELILTVPFVLFGLFRYWFVVDQLDGGESPTDVLLADWQLMLTVLAWVGVCAYNMWPR